MSFRASPQTGVGIPRLEGKCIKKQSKYEGDCHTSDIGHWFAMTVKRNDKLKFDSLKSVGWETGGFFCAVCGMLKAKGRDLMQQEEKKPIAWEVKDPKPPIIQSGKMENRKQN